MSHQTTCRVPQIWKDISNHRNKMGLIVGRGGCNLKEVERVTGAKVWVNRDRLYIRGEREEMDAAIIATAGLIKRVCDSYRENRRKVRSRHEPERKQVVRVQIMNDANSFAELGEDTDDEAQIEDEYPKLPGAVVADSAATWVEASISSAVLKKGPVRSRIKELLSDTKLGRKVKMPRRSEKSWADMADEWDEGQGAFVTQCSEKKVSWADMADESDDDMEEDLFLGSH